MRVLRNLVVLLFMGGGVWFAFWMVSLWASYSGGEMDFHLTREAAPLLIPVGMAGALVGAFIGGVFFPAQR